MNENLNVPAPLSEPDILSEHPVPADVLQAEMLGLANALLREFGALQHHLAMLRTAAQQDVERVAKRWELAAQPVAYRAERVREWLLQAAPLLPRPPKRKSVTLEAGTLGARSKPMRVTVEDKEAFLAWWHDGREDLDGLVRVKVVEEPALKDLRDYVEATGEVPPGCTVVPEAEEWYVTAARPDALPPGEQP